MPPGNFQVPSVLKWSGCSFVFWKDTSGRWFDRQTATRLLNARTLVDLHGFFRQSGDIYDATVDLSDEGKVIPKGAGDTTSSTSDVELCSCPLCDSGSIRITEFNYTCYVEYCKLRGLKNQMVKGVISPEDWSDMKEHIQYDYLYDNHFTELKNLEMITEKLNAIAAMDPYVGKYFSTKYIRSTILGHTEKQMEEMDVDMEDDIKSGRVLDPLDQTGFEGDQLAADSENLALDQELKKAQIKQAKQPPQTQNGNGNK